MTTLTDQPLKTCNSSSVALSNSEIEQLLTELNGWQLKIQQNIQQIIKTYKFNDFSCAMAFANQVTVLAEKENHHPRICIEWGKVSIGWWTHSLSGLYINDFILAARCDLAYQQIL